MKPKNKFSNPVRDALGKTKLLVIPSKQDHLQVIVMKGKRTEAFADINLKEEYTCTLSDGMIGCSHYVTDYCEHECHCKTITQERTR